MLTTEKAVAKRDRLQVRNWTTNTHSPSKPPLPLFLVSKPSGLVAALTIAALERRIATGRTHPAFTPTTIIIPVIIPLCFVLAPGKQPF
jgi:hypothetical protein